MSAYKKNDTVVSVRGICTGERGRITSVIDDTHVRVRFPGKSRSTQKNVRNLTLVIPDHLRMDEGL